MTQRHARLCALADSLPGAIRWRYGDYEALLKKELAMLLAAAESLPRRARVPSSSSS